MSNQDKKTPSPTCGESVARGAKPVGERVLLQHAKSLRTHQTDAEQRLWYYLRAQRFMGLKFKRQKPIGPFIADFICMEHRLVIEADGGQHGGDTDAGRDAWFKAQGYVVLHFWNNDVLVQTEAVLERIRQVVFTLSPSRLRPPRFALPASGRGEDLTVGDD